MRGVGGPGLGLSSNFWPQQTAHTRGRRNAEGAPCLPGCKNDGPAHHLPAQLPSPHHVDGLRVTGKAEGIATGRGAKVDGHHHGEGSLLRGSGLGLLQIQDLESGSSPRARLTALPLPWLWSRLASSTPTHLPSGLPSLPRLQAEPWKCQLPLR